MRSSRLRTALLAALVFPAANTARTAPLKAQTPRLEFEVASIKPSRSGPGQFRIDTQPGGRFVATNVTLRALIQYAYRMQPYQVFGGAAWLGSDHFDIVAKAGAIDGDQQVSGESGASRTQLMVRALLADRFKLAVHTETRELPMYALALARADGRFGSGLHRAAVDCRAQTAAAAGSVDKAQAADTSPCGIRLALGSMVVGGATFPQVATALSGLLDRAVVDRTGLAGAFDATLRWTPDESTPGMAAKAKYVPTIDQNGPSIFTAVQEQLGLKLEPARGQVDVLVIISAQQPSPN